MRNLALTVSVVTFFAMALVGMASGQTVFSCAVRAICGAIVSYVAASMALKLAVDVMVKAVVESGEAPTEDSSEDSTEEKVNGEQTN